MKLFDIIMTPFTRSQPAPPTEAAVPPEPEQRSQLVNPTAKFLSLFHPVTAVTGKSVTPDSAMHLVAVFACVRVIAETIATLPVHLYQRTTKGKEKAVNHPLYDLLQYQPNAEQNACEWLEMLLGHLLLRGNAYCQIVRNRFDEIVELIPLHPDRIRIERKDSGLVYHYTPMQGESREFRRQEIFHVRGLSSDGIYGLAPVDLAREALGLGLAQEEYAARLFGNGARPSGVFEYPGQLDQDAYNRLLESYEQKYAGLQNAHRPMVLEEGMKWHQMQLTNEQSQFIESRKFQKEEIATLFRVPPHKIGLLERATFSNIEHQSIEFVTDTLRPWLVRLEKAMMVQLLTLQERRRYFVRFTVEGLLRGDTKSRNEAYQIGVTNGWLSRNEVREWEDLDLIEDEIGDAYIINANLGGKGTHSKASSEDRAATAPNVAAGFAVVFADAYARAQRAELKQLSSTFERFIAENRTEQAEKWLAEFYYEHREYIARILSPTVRALFTISGAADEQAVEKAAGLIADREIVRHRAELSDVLRLDSVAQRVDELERLRLRWESSVDAVAEREVLTLLQRSEARHVA